MSTSKISHTILGCGYPGCKHKAKMYGVCGRHASEYGYTHDTQRYLEDVAVHRKIIREYKDACDEIERQGGSVLGIQSGYDNNLCGPRTRTLPNVYERAAQALEKISDHIKIMQSDYTDIAGKNMIYNVNARECQKILDPDFEFKWDPLNPKLGILYQLGKNVGN